MPAAKKTTITRYVGKCPICEADQKLTTDAMPSVGIFWDHEKMVHHSFTRPGDGEIHGGCYAVGAPPYEVSCEITRTYRDDVVAPKLAYRQSYLERLENGEVTQITELSWNRREATTITIGNPTWNLTLREEIARTKSAIRALTIEVARLNNLINNWTAQPLRTVEEFEGPKAAEKAAAKAKRVAAKAAKLAAKIASYQKRIDSAVAKRKGWTIAEIFESAQRSLRCDFDFTVETAISAIGRNHVFTALGFNPAAHYSDPQNDALRYAWYEFASPDRPNPTWPASLV